MKAVISNFSMYKTPKLIKTLPAIIIFFIFYSCSSVNSSKIRYNSISFDDNTRFEIVKKANSLIGAKYRYGGNSPKKGFDCSGFTSYVFNTKNIILPRSSKSQSKIGKKIKLKNAQPGDLIFFKSRGKINHVAIVVENSGNSIIIVHSTSSKGVKKDDVLNSKYWKKRITFVTDVISY